MPKFSKNNGNTWNGQRGQREQKYYYQWIINNWITETYSGKNKINGAKEVLSYIRMSFAPGMTGT